MNSENCFNRSHDFTAALILDQTQYLVILRIESFWEYHFSSSISGSAHLTGLQFSYDLYMRKQTPRIFTTFHFRRADF